MEGKRRRTEQEIDEELKEGESVSESEESEDAVASISSTSTAKRGRPRLPIVWSRVMHIKDDKPIRAAEHWVSVDSDVFLKNREKVEPKRGSTWKPMFHPKAYAKENDIECTQDYEMSERQLMIYGKNITRLRKEIRSKASELSLMNTRFDWKGDIVKENFEVKEERGHYKIQVLIDKEKARA